MPYKTKGQQPQVAKLELLALFVFRGGVAEWSNAADCKSVNGGPTTVLGFESLLRRQNSNYTPAATPIATGARTAQPKPYESVNLSIRLLAVELNRRFHSDMHGLPGQTQESREASQRPTALSLHGVRQDL